jgi:cell division protein FtsN
MTPPDQDRPDVPEPEMYDETPPRSIFAATWFRAVLVLLVIGAVGAVAVPYILDAMNPPPKPSVVSRPTPAPAPPAAVTPAPAPAAPTIATPPAATADKAAAPDKPAADKPATAMPATPRKPLAGAATQPADKTVVPDKAAADKPATAEKAAAKTDTRVAAAEARKPAAGSTKRAAATATPATPKSAAAGAWWVQVGAFRDQDTARKVAAKLREQNYKVEESVRGATPAKAAAATPDKAAPAASAAAPAGADQYDVFVSGLSAEELGKKLSAKGLAAEPMPGGAVIKPSLPLRDAVALSKDLAVEGFKVQVRRAPGAATAATVSAPRPAAGQAAPPAAGGEGETLYRVRVGAFPDRATAVSTLKELEGKGYKPFIARGGS